MKLRFAFTLFAAAALCLACSGGGDDSPADSATPSPAATGSEADLRATFEDAVQSFVDADFDAFYGYFSKDFQARCPKKDFDRIMAIAAVFVGDALDDTSFKIDSVRIENGRGYVTASAEGEEPSSAEGELTDFWVYEGAWKAGTDQEKPCEFDTALDGNSGSDNKTPETGPGTSRAEAVGIGDKVRAGDLEYTVLDVNLDATDDDVDADFSNPPPEGRRYVLVTVRAKNVGEDEGDSQEVSASDFKITGSSNVAWDYYSDESSCGSVDDELRGELFPGGQIEGRVCFQVPDTESGLMLFVQPFASFDDANRRYLRLQ